MIDDGFVGPEATEVDLPSYLFIRLTSLHRSLKSLIEFHPLSIVLGTPRYESTILVGLDVRRRIALGAWRYSRAHPTRRRQHANSMTSPWPVALIDLRRIIWRDHTPLKQ